ncbi:FkbM family methyltransferase [Pseudokineococcus sp. 1T1Z-3]|uniref:FkbM family methyltransferase n=1 Tax=Pseudokineococcus sp. 1T1Z-3 TaxID=3132745 RepID=UPI00309F8FAD
MAPADVDSPAGAPRAGEARRRRQSWWGAKRHVKRAVSLPGVSPAAHAVLARRSGAVAAARLPVPLTVRRVTARVGGQEFTMLDPSRCVVAKELYWGGGRRPAGADHLALEAFAALAPSARTVVDVGAYTGVFSLLGALAAPSARVVAVELVPANAVALLDNLLANDLLPRVEVHLAGVGRDGGTLRVPSGRGGSALPDFLSVESEAADGVLVPTRSLDALLTGGGAAPDGGGGPVREGLGPALVKVDVEGAEVEVLGSGRRFLEATRPDLLLELLPAADVPGVERALQGLGLRAYLVTDDALVEHARPHADARHRDWLLTPRAGGELAALGLPVVPLGG